MRRKQPSGGGRRGLLIAILAIVVLAGAGYAGFLWWQGRESADALVAQQPAVTPAPIPVQPAPVAAATATEPPPAAAPVSTTTTPPVATATVPTAPFPSVTAAPPPTTAAAAPSSPARERYDAMARQFAASPSGNYTVQIQILCDPANLTKAIAAGGSNVWFVPQPIGARSCYRVFWGRYETQQEAQQALAQIPSAVRDRSAAVKPVPRG